MPFLVLGKERIYTEFLVSFKPLLKVLAHADTILLLLLTQLEGHELVSSDPCSDSLSKCSELIQMKFPTCHKLER
jgi:hypothetical protein